MSFINVHEWFQLLHYANEKVINFSSMVYMEVSFHSLQLVASSVSSAVINRNMSLTKEGRDDLSERKGVWVQTCMVRGAIKGKWKKWKRLSKLPLNVYAACLCLCTPCSSGFMPICFIFIWRFTNYDIQLLTGFRTRLTCFASWTEITCMRNRERNLKGIRKIWQVINLKI